MPIIIDVNSIPAVFGPDSSDHSDFEPVKNWIENGRGKMVYGGTKYIQELMLMRRYLTVLSQLRTARKIVVLKNEKVDADCEQVCSICGDFNDPHLVAIARVSGCRLICSKDREAYPFLVQRSFYQGICETPKIYSGSQNRDLLYDRRNIPERLRNVV